MSQFWTYGNDSTDSALSQGCIRDQVEFRIIVSESLVIDPMMRRHESAALTHFGLTEFISLSAKIMSFRTFFLQRRRSHELQFPSIEESSTARAPRIRVKYVIPLPPLQLWPPFQSWFYPTYLGRGRAKGGGGTNRNTDEARGLSLPGIGRRTEQWLNSPISHRTFSLSVLYAGIADGLFHVENFFRALSLLNFSLQLLGTSLRLPYMIFFVFYSCTRCQNFRITFDRNTLVRALNVVGLPDIIFQDIKTLGWR